MNQDSIKEIAILVQKEFGHVNEVYTMTKELADAFSRNDRTSARMILKMRGQEIVEIDKIRRKITMLLNQNRNQKPRWVQVLKGEQVENPTESEDRICRISKSMMEVVKKTVETDQHMSRRFGE